MSAAHRPGGCGVCRIRPNLIESRLRLQNPPIIVRLEEDKLLIDLRTVFPDQERTLIDSLRKALM